MLGWRLEACAWDGMGRILLPEETFLVGPLVLKGPCKGPIVFQLKGVLKAPTDLNISNSEFQMFGLNFSMSIDYWSQGVGHLMDKELLLGHTTIAQRTLNANYVLPTASFIL